MFTHDSGRTPPSASAFETQHTQATYMHRGDEGDNGIAPRRGRGRGSARIAAGTCHVARNAIFTHGMRAFPRCRAPGWPDDFSAAMSDAARPSCCHDAPRSLTRYRSRRSQGRAPRVSSLHATTQRHPSNVIRARHVATTTQAPRGSATAERRPREFRTRQISERNIIFNFTLRRF